MDKHASHSQEGLVVTRQALGWKSSHNPGQFLRASSAQSKNHRQQPSTQVNKGARRNNASLSTSGPALSSIMALANSTLTQKTPIASTRRFSAHHYQRKSATKTLPRSPIKHSVEVDEDFPGTTFAQGKSADTHLCVLCPYCQKKVEGGFHPYFYRAAVV